MNKVYAKKYLILPGTDECQIEKIAMMFLEHPRDTHFIFEPGCYHFYQENTQKRSFAVTNSDQAEQCNIALLMEGMENVLLDGQGAQFIFHGDMTPIAISCCQRIKVKNFSIDFEIPLSAEARILSANKNEIEIFLDHTIFPYAIEDETLIFDRGHGQKAPLFAALEFDAQTNKVRAGAGDTFPKVKAYEVEPDIVCLKGDFTVLPQLGNILVLRHGKRIHPGAFIQDSEDISIEYVKVHQTCGLGFVFQFCKDILVSHVSFCANYRKGRMVLSGHDDGLHFSNNKGTILVEHCSFHGLMDDSINVHGTAVCILKKTTENTLRCVYRHPQSVGFEKWAMKGDQIAFLNKPNRICEKMATVLEYKLLSPTEFELTFTTPISSSEEELLEYVLENLTNTPALICRKNYFGSNRARGLLFTTPKPALIEDNVFESSGSAILIAGDVNEWYESGTCTDVTIRNNKFLNCFTSKYQFCNAVIHIEPGVTSGQKEIVHHGIRIEDNLFVMSSKALLYADHTGDITLRGNCIFMNEREISPALILSDCENIQADSNILNSANYPFEFEEI